MSTIQKWITKADRILILLFLFTGIVLTVFVFLPQSGEDGILEVRQNGRVVMTLPLNKTTERTVTDADGHQNHFIIRDGTVVMTKANCHDRTCVRTGKIKKSGQSIVCLPHRLVLAIVPKSSSDHSLDAVVQ